jgi:CheY-like chemotaxis protein
MVDERKLVLVADDDKPVRDLETAILEQSGYRVVHAADGAAAIERLREDRPDLVLLDLVMPEVDGWGVLEHVRTMPVPPAVIVVSGMHEIVPPGHLSRYVSGYVFKPFNVAQLIRTCAEAVALPPRVPASGDRKEPRRTFIVETTLVSDTGVPLITGRLLQVSRSGFRMELAIPLNAGDPVQVVFRVPGRAEPLALKGKVRWRKDLTLGAEIDSLRPDEEKLLRELVDGADSD